VNKLVPIGPPSLPALVPAAGERAAMSFLEFFAANIRNLRTRKGSSWGTQRGTRCSEHGG
jgi:hypothetical protein